MKIDFKVQLHDLDGNPVMNGDEPLLLNKTLANMLARDAHKDTGIGYADAMEWALAINKGEVIDLKENEQELLKKFIENAVEINALTKMELVKVFKKP